MAYQKTIWIDIINPSHALFFSALIPELFDFKISVTYRNRAETIQLGNKLGIRGRNFGNDYQNPVKKTLNMIYRTMRLSFLLDPFDYSLSFENGMSIFVSKLRRKKSILFCDNDLKFLQMTSGIQDLESQIKMMADTIIVPEACYKNFVRHTNPDRVFSFKGYKENVYLADFNPDPSFIEKIPFEQYVVVRPEAIGSFYVNEKKSIVQKILELLRKENINVIFLPRDKEDYRYSKGFDDIFIPKEPLNGLDLCYYADAILTGSGTMAREAACMGKKAISFFPSKNFLSVDQRLIEGEKIFHSRDPEIIIEYIQSLKKPTINDWKRESIGVKNEIIKMTSQKIHADRNFED